MKSCILILFLSFISISSYAQNFEIREFAGYLTREECRVGSHCESTEYLKAQNFNIWITKGPNHDSWGRAALSPVAWGNSASFSNFIVQASVYMYHDDIIKNTTDSYRIEISVKDPTGKIDKYEIATFRLDQGQQPVAAKYTGRKVTTADGSTFTPIVFFGAKGETFSSLAPRTIY